MIEASQPPDLDDLRHLVDEYLARQGVTHWAQPRARYLMGVVGGRPRFSELVDHVGSRRATADHRHRLALAVALAAVAPPPPPVSTHVAPMWDALAQALEGHRGADAHVLRQDRLALDLVIAATCQAGPWPLAWEVPRFLLVIAVEGAINTVARGGVDLRLGFLPNPPSVEFRADKLGAALTSGNCGCGGPEARSLCARPGEHRLDAWDPATSTLCAFIDRAVAGPFGDGRYGLTEAPALAGAGGRRR